MRAEWLIVVLALALGGCAGAGRAKDAPGDGRNALTLLHQADAAYAKGAWAQAESRYRAVIRRVPQDPYAWFKLGNLFTRTGRPDEAIYAYREALVRNGKYGKAYHNLGIAYLIEAQRALQASLGTGGAPDSQSAATRALLQRLTALVSGGNNGATPAPSGPPKAARQRQSHSPAAPVTALAEHQRLAARIIPGKRRVPDVSAPQEGRPAGPKAGPVIIEVGGGRPPTHVAANSSPAGAPGDARPYPVLIRVGEPSPAAGGHTRRKTVRGAGARFKVLPLSLTLRAQPEIGAPAITRLARGAIVRGLPGAKNPAWRRIRYRDHQGWVLAQYLSPDPDRGAPRSPTEGAKP